MSSPSKPKYIQEKCMAVLALFFFGGIALFTFAPEGAIRGMSMGIYSIGMIYAMYRIAG
jgi:hypothetical protein